MAEEGLLVQSKHLFEININPGGATPEWARLAKGFNSFEPSTNEEIDQTNYLDGEGFGTTTVMGAQLTLTFSGHRYYGDPAQDFIFSKAMEIGNERETEFRWTLPTGEVFEGPCTLAEISGPSGTQTPRVKSLSRSTFNGNRSIPRQTGGGVEG